MTTSADGIGSRLAQALELDGRQADTSRFEAMRGVAVEIRSPGHQQIQFTCERAVSLHQGRVVIRVKHFNGVEPRVGERFQPRFEAKLARVRERSDAAGAVNDANDRLRRGALARDEPRSTVGQPSIEGILDARHIPGGHHRARDLWTPDRPAARRGRFQDEGVNGNRHAQGGEPRTDGFDTRDPGRTLRKEKRSERRVIGVDKVSEHVDVPLVVNRGDLNAVDGPYAVLAGDSANLDDSGDGVVVGH